MQTFTNFLLHIKNSTDVSRPASRLSAMKVPVF